MNTVSSTHYDQTHIDEYLSPQLFHESTFMPLSKCSDGFNSTMRDMQDVRDGQPGGSRKKLFGSADGDMGRNNIGNSNGSYGNYGSTDQVKSVEGARDSTKYANSAVNIKTWAQDRKRPGGVSQCLWTDVREVVPCVCGKARRAVPLQPLIVKLEAAAERHNSNVNGSSKEGERTKPIVRLPLLEGVVPDFAAAAENSTFTGSECGSRPYFFGIDCRTHAERQATGTFPKSFVLEDPSTCNICRLLYLYT